MTEGQARGRPASVVRALLPPIARVVLTTAALLLIYANWPLESDYRVSLVVRLLGGLVGLGLIFGFQLRSILRSQTPGVRAIEALASSIPLLLIVFAGTYVAMSSSDPAAFTEPLTKNGALYFTITILATVGFGDIAPVSDAARLVVSLQMLVDLVILGVGIRVVVGAIQISRKRREDGPFLRGPEEGPSLRGPDEGGSDAIAR